MIKIGYQPSVDFNQFCFSVTFRKIRSSLWHEDGHHNGFNKVPHNDNKMLEDMSEDVAEQDYEGNYQFFSLIYLELLTSRDNCFSEYRAL